MHLISAMSWPSITGSLALLDIVLVASTVFWILSIKKEPTSALAWCLLVVFLPIFGAIFFVMFGYQSIHVPLKRKRRHAQEFRGRPELPEQSSESDGYEGLAGLARRLGAMPLVGGNAVTLYSEGAPAYDAMLQAIAQAGHHIHMQFFIVRADESGERFMTALAAKAREGVQVRFLYDAVGSWRLGSRALRILTARSPTLAR